MKELLNLLNAIGHIKDFDKICIGLASPEKIRSWSYGEVKTAETINYRTFKPEHEGLFCARIFGPLKDYECVCGKYKLFKHKGIVCEKCGVETIQSKVRRERMGHIELATPIVHTWYLKSLPSRIGLLLDISLRDLERILYFETYVVIAPNLTPLKRGQLLSETTYQEAVESYGHKFDARIGGEAIYELLRTLDLAAEISRLREQINTTHSETLLKKYKKRLMLVQTFFRSKNRPEWMVLKVLPILPPDLRPLVALEGVRFATSDLNGLYRQVINRNNRIKHLLELNAPEVVIRNEIRMLQEAVDALFDNGRRNRTFTGTNKLPLHSLSDMIKGKQGRFRQHLLGKRVDYSGRSVIVVNPSLKLHQCGLPKEMALELFKPSLFHLLQKCGLAVSINVARELVERKIPEIWPILEEVVREHPVLLNRAPTLYRLGIQAFEPVLIEGKAIQLHPLVCKAFNANFDGDHMAVHVPLSLEAQMEARVLMMSDQNVVSPANGDVLIVPSQEMVLGLYFMTCEREGVCGEDMIFTDINEVERAYENGVVDLHASIFVRFKKRVKTTVGRALLSKILPKDLSFDWINQCLTNEILTELINFCYHHVSLKETRYFVNHLMYFGFTYATRSGITLGIEDMIILKQKSTFIDEAFVEINNIQKQYIDGLITDSQRYNKTIDIWTQTNDKMTDAILNQLSENHLQNPRLSYDNSKKSKNKLLKKKNTKTVTHKNTLHIMMDAGVQNPMQICQIVGMRGLMTKQDGSIIETPIIANFREGLNMHQYFLSTHGTRKSLADMALRTANAGYLTRRLVDVAQDVIIVEQDCATTEGLTLTALVKEENRASGKSESNQIIESFRSKILGRVVAQDIFIGRQKKPAIQAGTLLDEVWVKRLEDLKFDSIKVRSPMTCQSEHGVCAMCYGRDLGRGQLVNIGEAIGVIAAQSIGESGTQLTMRTHHAGEIAKRTAAINFIETRFKGTVKFYKIKLLKPLGKKSRKKSTVNSQFIVVSQEGEVGIIDERGIECEHHKIPYGATFLVNDLDKVKVGQLIATWEPHIYPIITEFSGYIRFVNILEGITVNREIDENTGRNTLVVKDPRQRPTHAKDLPPMLKIVDKHGNDLKLTEKGQPITYNLPPYTIINVEDGAKVNIGNIIARLPINIPKTCDITNSLFRVVDLFEARIPKEPAILAFRPGLISFGKDTKTKHRCIITDKNGQQEELSIPKWRLIKVCAGQQVEIGTVIVEGEQNLHDILHLKGINELVKYFINEMKKIYNNHDIKINDKHFEVIIRQMLRTVTVLESGDTPFLRGEFVTRNRLLKENQRIKTQSGKPATWIPNLLGITKASLATESFISAASFMDTTRVLLTSTIKGRCDELRGLKENVIIGRLTPAGTGLAYHKGRQQ
ncbi:DNA-directed RNA polymerase subunit beta' [Candidatus Parabeggiatoa sp. HSG14]|uniref:DNA-directed RNA polymerase subunit beta' n=1 Tax=Candidatus Parabeggiatoa sp. HSG14 TaxID=3055593 RepID=UPI0025A81D6C|nr:DNA-directed RNA polymerase subunit beta' [Thiotrichales bacterium HSG14]